MLHTIQRPAAVVLDYSLIIKQTKGDGGKYLAKVLDSTQFSFKTTHHHYVHHGEEHDIHRNLCVFGNKFYHSLQLLLLLSYILLITDFVLELKKGLMLHVEPLPTKFIEFYLTGEILPQ